MQSPLLSLKAKGLLTYFLSKPDDWKIRRDDLIANNKDGRDAIYSGMKELEKQGYLIKNVSRDKSGRLHTNYTVYEVSQLKDKNNERKNQQNGEETKKNIETAKTKPIVAEKLENNAKPKAEEIKPNESIKKGEYDDILVGIPVADKKALLDTLNHACKTRDIKNPLAYLRGLIKRYKAGTFEPVKKESNKTLPVQKPGNGRPVSQVIKHCPHCDNDGMLSGHILDDGESHIKRRFSSSCSHNKKSIDDFINRNHGKLLEIYTSDDDEYRFPPGHQLANQEMIRRHGLALEKRGKAKEAEKQREELGSKNNGSGAVFKRIGDLLK